MVAKKESPKTIIIDESVHVAFLKLSDNQAIDISLIRSKGNRYVAVNRMHKTKAESEWKHGKAIWLPYDKAKSIAEMLQMAYDKGLALGWDKPFIEEPPLPASQVTPSVEQAFNEVQVALDKLKETISTENKGMTQEQLSLFDKLTSNLFK